MSQALLAILNVVQNSNTFNKSRETVLVTSFGDEKVTRFSGFLPTSVNYLKVWCAKIARILKTVVQTGAILAVL